METIGDCPKCGKRSFIIKREASLTVNIPNYMRDSDLYKENVGRCYCCGYKKVID
jgi:hypothetical protein